MIKSYFFKSTKKNAPRWLVLFIDVFLVLQTFVVAYFIYKDFSFRFDVIQVISRLPVIAVFALFSFLIVGSYRGLIRYTDTNDALNIYTGVSLLSTMLVIVVLISRNFYPTQILRIPIVVLIIHYLLNVILLITSRYVFKWLYRKLVSNLHKFNPVLIYGAGEMGMTMCSTLQKDVANTYRVVGFIDDDLNKKGKTINRLPILNRSFVTKDFLEKNEIGEIIIAIPNIDPSYLLEIVDEMYALGVEVKIAPKFSQWAEGNFSVGQIKQVKIGDLLERTPIHLDNPLVSEELNNNTVFITGAAGSIGSEIAMQVVLYQCKQVVLIDQSESALYDLQQELNRNNNQNWIVKVADIRDLDCMEALFETYRPNIIFHAAAYKHVPLMEDNPYEAVKINVNGTKIIADLALKHQVQKFVLVSTDKAVNPTNVMGASKRVAEMYITCMNKKAAGITKFITTRFGNVLGSNGSVIPLFKRQIETGGPLTLTHKEITRYFMTIPEACQLVIEAGAMGKGGEIFVFDMGTPVKIFDLAKKLIHLSGLEYPRDIDIKITGLRPGEKLYEELLNTTENTIPTHHEKILIGKFPESDCQNINQQIGLLCKENSVKNIKETVRRIKSIVPEYKSENSVFSNLDTV